MHAPTPHRPRRPAAFALLALLATSCSSAWHERRADESAQRILDTAERAALEGREEWVRLPEVVASEPSGPTDEDPDVTEREALEPGAASDGPPPRVLTLPEALSQAVRTNRELQRAREGLLLTALGLVGVRHDFSPQLAAALSYALTDGEASPKTLNADFVASVSQILPLGGLVQLDAVTGHTDSSDPTLADPDVFSSRVAARLVQPLLRGAGYEVSHEALVQAERNLMYAVRDFELFREDFSIDVARRYYDLVEQQRNIENQQSDVDLFVFARRQAEALFRVGRTNELNVLRARRSELNSLDSLIQAQEDYRLALDRFRIFLGLEQDAPVDVARAEPVFVPVAYSVASAVEVALANRLDVINRREQLEDAERGVRLARNGLLPSLDLALAYAVDGRPDSAFTHQNLGTESWSAAVALELPVDRVDERNAYRAAQIALDREARSLDQFLDEVAVEIESAFRELARREQSLDIQRELIRDQEKNLRIAQIQFEQGTVENRDVVEAQQALTEARNGLIQEQVNYEIARLELLRNLGILFVDERGMWTE